MTVRWNMCCLVAASKHINDMQVITRCPPITTIENLIEAVFSVESAPRLYSKASGLLTDISCGIFTGIATT
jgi:hypothetical protein